MDEDFRSWRLMSVLKAEISAGNTVVSTNHSRDSVIVILENIFMSPLQPDDGVVEYIEQTFAPNCYKNVYHDKQTNEYLACRIPKTFLGKILGMLGMMLKKK
ncbi:MAG: hypothetical protein K2J80_03485 [Oscillospiraceae bacterium]|nr:hypothetical protein [Oscillospiraceae bacterium]